MSEEKDLQSRREKKPKCFGAAKCPKDKPYEECKKYVEECTTIAVKKYGDKVE